MSNRIFIAVLYVAWIGFLLTLAFMVYVIAVGGA